MQVRLLLELDCCGKPENLLHSLELLWEAEQELNGRGPDRLALQGLEWSTLLYSELYKVTARWQGHLKGL